LSGFQALYTKTGNATYLAYIESTVKASMGGFSVATKTLDNVKEGTAVLFMYENTTIPADIPSYQTKAVSIRPLLGLTAAAIRRTSEGGFWHKDPAYNSQMWGDGLYMAAPFYAQYSVLFNSSAPADFDDIANQFIFFENHARDASTGLLYHGWSENPTNAESVDWANPVTGCSPSFWARAMGWYIMGLVDVLDYFPPAHPKYPQLVAILQRLVPALINVQEPISGCWYDVVDQGTRCSSSQPTKCNYLESSASCMITYSILKAVRLGYVDNTYLAAGKKAYEGLITTFVTTSGASNEYVTISNNCQVSGLGGTGGRDGSFDYYMSEPIVTSVVEGKPIGPFILASLEYEAIPPACLNLVSIPITSLATTAVYSMVLFDAPGTTQIKILADGNFNAGNTDFSFSKVGLVSGTYTYKLMSGVTVVKSGTIVLP
jgi:unsaturated rhamnogalacturonyl hydrolase